MKRFSFLIFVLLALLISRAEVGFGQFSDTASMRIIEQNRSAAEGDLYLDTVAKIYKIGLTHGKLGSLNDNQKFDSLKQVGDSLVLFLENGGSQSIFIDSLKEPKVDILGLNYFMWDISNTSTPNISNKTRWGTPTSQGVMTAALNNTHRNQIAPSPQQGYALYYSGVLKVQNTGDFTFISRSDDGTRVYVDDVMVLENWFQQAPRTRFNTVTLAKGEHKIEFWFYENSGGDYMEFFWGANPDGYPVNSLMQGNQFYIK